MPWAWLRLKLNTFLISTNILPEVAFPSEHHQYPNIWMAFAKKKYAQEFPSSLQCAPWAHKNEGMDMPARFVHII